MTVTVRVRRLPHSEGLPLPTYASLGAAGADLYSAEPAATIIEPGQRVAVATGLLLEIPDGYEAQVRPRSGLAVHHGVTVVNGPGTIDSDFRGEVKVLLVNLGDDTATVQRGDRVAQLVIAPVIRADFVEATDLADTERGGGGFGSTGT